MLPEPFGAWAAPRRFAPGAARDYGLFHFADCLFLLVGRGAEIGAAVFFAIHAWNRTLSRDGA
ncbi:MAG: hypothetical protein WAS33_05840 [Candidatus Promineifilaceae bacterium]